MTSPSRPPQGLDEARIAEILGRVDARQQPPEEAMDAARESVRTVWREEIEARRSGRRWRGWAAAAGVILTMGVAFVVTQMAGPATGSIELVQTDNRVQFHAGGSAQWRDVSGPQSLEPGDRLRTGPGGFALIEFPRGVSVRVDNTSEFELLADDRLYLDAGAVYVDAAGPGSMQIATEHGTARDIGTRFEVRLVDEGWQVSVRDGAVVLRDGDRGEARALAGERLTVAGGELRRDSVGPADASWRWTHSALRPMEIEGRMLSSYLTWWSRESGVEVVYAKPIDSSIAAQTRLHGDLGGLSLEAGFDAVIAGTGFRVLDRDMQRVIVTN